MILSLFAIRGFLRSAGENLWSVFAVPLGTLALVWSIFSTGGTFTLPLAIEAGASGEALLSSELQVVNSYFLSFVPGLLSGICILVGQRGYRVLQVKAPDFDAHQKHRGAGVLQKPRHLAHTRRKRVRINPQRYKSLADRLCVGKNPIARHLQVNGA